MKPKAFVLMPFDSEFDQIFNLFIVPALTEGGYDVFRADNIISQQNILRDIIDSILKSDLIIADLSKSNPNVYYELGIAHSFGKPVILLTQEISDLPFDLRSYRVIPYNTHFAQIDDAREKLKVLGNHAIDGSVPFGNPVTDFTLSDRQPFNKGPSYIESKNEELGYIDHLIRMLEGFNSIGLITRSVGEKLRSDTAETEKLTATVSEASSKNVSIDDFKNLQKLMAEFAQSQDVSADELHASNDIFSKTIQDTGDSLETVVSSTSPITEEDRNQVYKLIDALSILIDSASQGKTSFINLAKSIERTPKMEKNLTSAFAKKATEIRRFVTNTEQVIAMATRAKNILEKKLSE